MHIGIVLFDDVELLDMAGPYEVFTTAARMHAREGGPAAPPLFTVHTLACSAAPVRARAGLRLHPDHPLASHPPLTCALVPGGVVDAELGNGPLLAWIQAQATSARILASVCTGSLLLGAAGLLAGYRATSHWATKGLLPIFGATPSDGRVVDDRNRITGGGVTAGIDFGLAIVGRLRDRQYAEGVQLIAEYDPKPPYSAGTPESAPPEVTAMIEGMFTGFVAEAEKTGRTAFARFGNR